MQHSTKKILILAGLTVVTLFLGVVAVITAMKLRQVATVPVAPNVPQSQPRAQVLPTLTPITDLAAVAGANACVASFTIPPRTCAQSCTTDADCGTAGGVQLKCSSGMCLNPACTTNKTDCTCGTPQTCFIQGVKVIYPANDRWGNNDAVENQTVRLDSTAKTSTSQPYSFTGLELGTSHTVSVDVPAGYRAGYSVCYNRIDCHTQAQNFTMVWKDNDTFVCPTTVAAGTAQGYVDLWWHFEPLPTGVPTPVPSNTPGPTATPGPSSTPTPASHGTTVVAPTSPPPQLPVAGATLPSVGLMGMGGLLLILGLAVILL